MDTPSDEYKPYYGSRSGPFLAVLRSVKGLVRRLIGIFALTEEEQLKAGIYLGGEGRDG
jgi:hypothetical protein